MGNANGREGDHEGEKDLERLKEDSPDWSNLPENSADLMINSPPESPRRFRSPLMFTPQIPVSPLQVSTNARSAFNQLWSNDIQEELVLPPEQGIPTLITWNHGGKEVAVEGSWDNWKSRRVLQRSGKDYFILLVLPSGIFHYRFIVDGELKYLEELPHIIDDTGCTQNILDVHDYVPENVESIAGFEPPPSPDSSYSQSLPVDEDFAKEPPIVPSQLHVNVLGMQDSEEASSSSSKPQHVGLNHLFIEKGWGSQSLVALGLTHRFHSKYVTVVLYKSLKRSN